MPDASPVTPRRHSRFWLFAPVIILTLLAGAWTTAWVVIRDRASGALDEWLAREATYGRQWICPSRAVGGFPFRIEVRCEALSLQRPDFRLSLGPVNAVAQLYRPRHIIVQAAGPLRASDGELDVEATWRRFEASIRTTPEGLQRASLVAEGPALRVSGHGPGQLSLSAQHLETHLRPNPARRAEAAYDWSLQAAKLVLPGLDALMGGGEPAELDLDLTATQAGDVAARPVQEELERWREAGGRIEIARLALAKGPRRIEGKGQLSIDDAHRLQGRADLAAAGIEGLLGTFMGARSGATAALLGALRGKPIEAEPVSPPDARGTSPGLKPLPPLRIEGGRVLFGPLPIPGIRIAPLY